MHGGNVLISPLQDIGGCCRCNPVSCPRAGFEFIISLQNNLCSHLTLCRALPVKCMLCEERRPTADLVSYQL